MADQPTAGFRNAGWTMGGLPEGTQVSVHPLRTADGAAVNGFLYAAGATDTVVCIMHPRGFHATHCTPEAWLSTWSSLSPRAKSMRTAAAIGQPCLFVGYTGDKAVFPADAEQIFAAIPSSSKQRLRLGRDHHGQPLALGEGAGRSRAGQVIRDHLQQHCH